MYKKNKKTTIAQWSMFSDEGNKQVDQIVKKAKKKELSWPEVWKELYLLHHKVGFGEAMDEDVVRSVYKNLDIKTPYYFYGITLNGKTLFDVFPDLKLAS